MIEKTADATGDLIENEIADRITKVSKTSQRNNSKTVTNEHDKEIPKDIYIYIYNIYNICNIYIYIYIYNIEREREKKDRKLLMI